MNFLCMSRRIFLKNNWKTIKTKASDPNISSPFAFLFSIPKYAREVAGDKFSVLPCSFIIFYFLSSTTSDSHPYCFTVLFSDTFVDGIPSVNTTISPASASCFAQIRSIALSQISSVVYTLQLISVVLTPQLICILLSVASSGLIPIIPVFLV